MASTSLRGANLEIVDRASFPALMSTCAVVLMAQAAVGFCSVKLNCFFSEKPGEGDV